MLAIPPLLTYLIKHFEGLSLKAYRCPSGIWTIGYGHTGFDVIEGLVITEQQAENILHYDIRNHLDATIKLSPSLLSAGDARLSAIGDFVFNLGTTRYKNSTLRRRVNSSEWEKASTECLRWVYGGGKKLKGLVARRKLEAELLLRG